MAVQLLSPSRSSSAIETLADEEVRRMNGRATTSSSSASHSPFTYPTSRSNSSSNNGMLGDPAMMDRQRSSSRISLRPSYDSLNTGASSTSISMSPSSTTVNGSIISAAPSVAAIGKVNVTDPWGAAWGMDSPYDASVAYASNPNRITMRQSAYFGSGLTLAALAGGSPYQNGAAGQQQQQQQHHHHHPASGSSLHPHPATAASSPAPSSFSSISGSAASSATTNAWSEASSSSSAFSHFNGNAPPSAPWINNDSHAAGGNNGKQRSVSFQGDLNQFAGGQPSPTYSSQSEGLPPSSASSSQYHHAHAHGHSQGQLPQAPNLRARSTTHLPSLIHHRHSGIPLNRRTTSTPGSEADRSAFRKSFIGGSVVNQSGAREGLPPVPVDPKVLAKMSSKKSLKSGNSAAGGNAGLASSRASIMSSSTDRTDAYSFMSGTTQDGSKKSKRKSWFARSPSSLSTAAETLSPNALAANSAATHSMLMGRSNTRRSSTAESSSGGRSPALSRASSGFGTNMSSPPPPTPPIPDTLPLPPTSSLGDKSRKSSTASLRQRVHAGGNQQYPSGASSPSPGLNEASLPSPHHRPHSAVQNGNSNGSLNPVNGPVTPLSARSKTSPTPSLYGTPLTSPSNAPSGAQQANTIMASTAPISSSPLTMSPMTSPTSASSHPLKPAAQARPAALQLSTLSENTMFPDSFPSPGTHHDALRRAEAEGLTSSTRTARGAKATSYVVPAQPAVTMSLPPTPIDEDMPIDNGQDNTLAPAAVIRPSPSSPPALGSLAALANAERSSTRSPTATPSSTRGRASPSGLPIRKDSRPNTPIDQVLQQHHQQGNESISTLQAVNLATPRSTSQGSTGGRSTYVSPPTSIASRKQSNNSLRATLSQAPPSPQPSSAIVEHVSAGNLLVDDDQFLPIGLSVPPSSPMSMSFEQPATQEKKAELPPPIPHQPTLNTSLSSFQVRKAFPDHRNISTLPIVPMLRKSSTQSVLPETVPLPDSPALAGNGFEAPPVHNGGGQLQAPLQPRGITPQPQMAHTDAPAKKLKPRASSPNMQAQNNARNKASKSKPLPTPNTHSVSNSKEAATPSRKSSKSPFSLFKRSRSKTLGDGSTSPSDIAAARLHAPAPALPTRSAASQQGQKMPAVERAPPATAQMTPAATPQLSFSSSTTSTTAGSEPSDQFYADFAPASRPSFTKNESSSSGNNTINAKTSNLNKSSASSARHQHQQPLNNANKSQNLPDTGKSKGFSRMFGASTKRKA